MAEQTKKASLKQPKVFPSSCKSSKGKRPGKGGNLFLKSIGLGFKTPDKPFRELTLIIIVHSMPPLLSEAVSQLELANKIRSTVVGRITFTL